MANHTEYYAPPQVPPTYGQQHEEVPPALPVRPSSSQQLPMDSATTRDTEKTPMNEDEVPPVLPPRRANPEQSMSGGLNLPPPPTRSASFGYGDDTATSVQYMRNPHKLFAFIVPFPKPDLKNTDASAIPDRFLIYTPPAPPLVAPKEGEKEDRMHRLQRKWQQEVREAKTNPAKVTSWKGVKGRATKGIDTAMGWTTTSSLDFLNRVPGNKRPSTPDPHSEDSAHETDQTRKTVGLDEMILIYPSTIQGDETHIREEFVNSMLRSKSKAQKDAVIATGLIPVAFAIDVLIMIVWPFGGLAEIDSVWAYSSIRGAKTARSVTKRLHSSSPSDTEHDDHKLKLSFHPSTQLDVLRRYLAADCHKHDPQLFKSQGPAPTESEVLEAIGWSPSQIGGETRNWEDEQWEVSEVKTDLKQTMGKASKEWIKWCKAFEKDPEKALTK